MFRSLSLARTLLPRASSSARQYLAAGNITKVSCAYNSQSLLQGIRKFSTEDEGMGMGGSEPPVGTGEKTMGTCKWFDVKKGFGFITPNDGSADVFVHHSVLHAQGFRSLAEGEALEFTVSSDDSGRLKAENVTGPDGSYVQGAPRIQYGQNQFGGGGYGGGPPSYGGGGYGNPGGYNDGGYGNNQGGYPQGGGYNDKPY